MSDVTPHLGLPLIAAAQAQKHVTHNEALGLLDALVQLACLDKDLSAPPASPAEGDRYLVTVTDPTGAWTGLGGQVVRFADGVWTGSIPRPGWFAYVVDEGDLYIFDGAAWTSFRRAIIAIETTGRLGINTTPDATNRLALKSDAALLSWDDVTPGSGDMRVAVNKQATARDAGLVFETGYSARALIGTLGGDDFRLKVSPDGASFSTVLTAAAATGIVGFAASPTAPTPASGDSSAKLATTAFVAAALAAGGGAGVPASRRIVAAGLATGGGDLTTDRTVTVPKASAAAAAAGTDDASAVTPLALATPLAGKVGTGRQIAAGTGLTGGGDLTADRTLAIAANGVTNALLAQVPAATLKGNAGTGAANVGDVTPSAILDAAFGTAQGGVLYRGAGGWAALAAGAAGQVLASGGSGANPSWAAPSGGGSAAGTAPVLDDVRMLAIQMAKLRGTVSGLFASMADDFRDQSGYDTASTTGANWDSASNTIRNQSIESAESLAAMTGNATPSGQTASATTSYGGGYEAYRAFDHTASTFWQGSMSGTQTLSRTFPTQNVSAIALQMRSDQTANYPRDFTIDLYDGSTWTTVITRTYESYSAGERRIYPVSGGNCSGIRINITATATVSGYVDIVGFEVLAGSISALNLRSIAFTAQAVPTKGSLFLLAKATAGTIAPNTNLIASISRDGGTTWNDLTLTQAGTIGGYAVLEANGLDISGQPSGTGMRWRLRTVGTTLAVTLDAVVMQWG